MMSPLGFQTTSASCHLLPPDSRSHTLAPGEDLCQFALKSVICLRIIKFVTDKRRDEGTGREHYASVRPV